MSRNSQSPPRLRASHWTLVAVLSLPFAVALAADIVPSLAVVTQQGRAFGVKLVSISRSGIIRFVNADDFDHQVFVASPDFTFESDEQSPGQTLEVRFTHTGTFQVRCHIHPKMHLQVDVD